MRKHERFQTTIPVRLGSRIGLIQNISESGIYFEIKYKIDIVNRINFDIEMDTSVGPMNLKCKGIVVRTERKTDRTGIAVHLLDSKFELMDQSLNYYI